MISTQVHGGGIWCGSRSTIEVVNSTIQDCSAADRGGGVIAFGNYSMNSSRIASCTAGSDGGGINAQSLSVVEVVESRIEDCSAADQGGGVMAFGLFSLSSSHIVNCSAWNDGGGIWGDDQSTIEVVDSRIEDCSAADKGGGVFVLGNYSMYSSRITSCTAGDDGGGIRGGSRSTIEVVNSTIQDCSAADRGGGVIAFGNYSMNSSRIASCTAGSDGGGINAQSLSVVEVVESRIEDCSAADQGGGVMAFGLFSLSSSHIVNCSAWNDGGGIWGDDQSTIEVVDSRIRGCSATYGGGVMTFGRLSLYTLRIASCTAEVHGSAEIKFEFLSSAT